MPRLATNTRAPLKPSTMAEMQPPRILKTFNEQKQPHQDGEAVYPFGRVDLAHEVHGGSKPTFRVGEQV